MATLFLLHRVREPERVFASAEGLIAVAMGAAEPGVEHFGHFDARKHKIEALKNSPFDEWLQIDNSTLAMRFEANQSHITGPIEG